LTIATPPWATKGSVRDDDSVRAAGAPGRPLKVLHIEDSLEDALLVSRELRRGGRQVQILRVETAEEMSAALKDSVWDVIISDHSLPTFDAPSAFALLRKMGLDLPFIIVSGTVGEEVAVEAMRTGVHDYLMKGNLRRLVAAVDREIRDAALRAEQQRTRQQLIIAERMASVGTLAAGVAHEINNPLSVIIGNLDFIQEALATAGGEVGEQVREPMADVKEAAQRVRAIVRDLRVFSRADEEARAPVDVRKVLDSSLRMARNEIRHRASVDCRYSDVPPVQCNEARLGQVFLNLLINAAHAIPEGRLDQNSITVSTHEAGSRVVVEVADTGSGIAPDVLPRIFDVFFTTKPVGVGTGLGLSICHRIVSAMDGEITVESQVGRGTTFRVSLPRATRGGSRDFPIVTMAKTAPGRRARIAIVDDEETLGRMLQRTLAPSHDAVYMTNGLEVLNRLDRGEQYDLILSDLIMPEMTGMDLHAEISKRSEELARKMVFMTGGAFTHESRRFLDACANPRIDKPVDIEQLKRLIAERVGTDAGNVPSPAQPGI
jgi:signal transduction histidine kinase